MTASIAVAIITIAIITIAIITEAKCMTVCSPPLCTTEPRRQTRELAKQLRNRISTLRSNNRNILQALWFLSSFVSYFNIDTRPMKDESLHNFADFYFNVELNQRRACILWLCSFISTEPAPLPGGGGRAAGRICANPLPFAVPQRGDPKSGIRKIDDFFCMSLYTHLNMRFDLLCFGRIPFFGSPFGGH